MDFPLNIEGYLMYSVISQYPLSSALRKTSPWMHLVKRNQLKIHNLRGIFFFLIYIRISPDIHPLLLLHLII
jgi:hypothetical protein